ncbi:uncharacterized protein LOC110943144 [Helianthus annuus]|uniref:uncharacterized protein LOC110943144 n=1 Tax=Helianthus annuus TaxID=4232 RepID=UPI000B9057FF|nr:uncharacterized protein LOC110943144 [Helianthus annuus]
MPGFEEFVIGKCRGFKFNGSADVGLATKLKFLKNRIKEWVVNEKKRVEGVYEEVKKEIGNLEKARVRWALEGDENSSFFHGIMSANTSINRLNGILLDGNWETSPPVNKDIAFDFFSKKIREPIDTRPPMSCPNLAALSQTEAESLIRPFTHREIKDAVWDCEGDRAPGPDGFNFKFLRRF